jgi:hypothetical protein
LRTRTHKQQIGADTFNLCLYRSLRALANAHHRNHRTHADDYSEHG